tara:strand:+ start:558 stop:815 length:258 start_codon:yes stop_codon:yes gene_type:complete
MIDTDKYEGHTPAKNWRKTDGSAMSIQSANNNADAELMADAPLLLAEVKRLREALLRIADTANGRPFISGHMDSFVGEVLKELIE